MRNGIVDLSSAGIIQDFGTSTESTNQSDSVTHPTSVTPSASVSPTSSELETAYRSMLEKLDNTKLRGDERGLICVKFATEHNLHFLGFCVKSEQPIYSEVK